MKEVIDPELQRELDDERVRWMQRWGEDPRQKFGYAIMVEKRAIRRRLIASGDPDDWRLGFKVEAAYIANHADDPTYAEICERRRAAQGPARQHVPFTDEELAYLAERFLMANDPIAAAIYDRVVALLSKAEARAER